MPRKFLQTTLSVFLALSFILTQKSSAMVGESEGDTPTAPLGQRLMHSHAIEVQETIPKEPCRIKPLHIIGLIRDACNLGAVTCLGIATYAYPLWGNAEVYEFVPIPGNIPATWNMINSDPPVWRLHINCTQINSHENNFCPVPISADPTGMLIPTLVLSSVSLGLSLVERLGQAVKFN